MSRPRPRLSGASIDERDHHPSAHGPIPVAVDGCLVSDGAFPDSGDRQGYLHLVVEEEREPEVIFEMDPGRGSERLIDYPKPAMELGFRLFRPPNGGGVVPDARRIGVDPLNSSPNRDRGAHDVLPSGAQQLQNGCSAVVSPLVMVCFPVFGLHPLDEGTFDQSPHVSSCEVCVGDLE